MPIQADPPFIDSVKAQAYRARLRAIYNAPSAIPAQRFNVQQPLPPVPYTNSANFPSYLDAQIKANPTTQPPTRIAPPLPPPITPITPPPTTNPVPRIAPPSGGGAAVVTVAGGGVISGGGLLTGGLVTGAAGLLLYDAWQAYKLFKLSQPEPKFGERETQSFNPNTQENITYQISYRATTYNPRDGSFVGSVIVETTAIGKIGSYRVARKGKFNEFYEAELYCKQTATGITRQDPYEYMWHRLPSAVTDILEISEFKINGLDSTLPSAPPTPRRSPIKSGIAPSATPQSVSSPSPTKVRSPTSPPPALDPLPTNNRIPYTITTPGSNPITITSPGAAPVVISPTGTPATIKITRPSASPFLSPSPATTPRATPITTPTGDPVTTPVGVPIAVSSPGSTPTELVMPGANPITINYPGQEPIVIDPVGSKPPQGVQAAPIPKPGAFTTTPIAPTQTPTNPVTTPTKPGTPTAPAIPGVKEPDLDNIGLKLVALTALIQGVNKNTTPNAIANAVGPAIAPAVCSTTAPGGCSSNMTNNAVGKGVDDLKDFLKKNGLDAAAQAEQLSLLNRLDSKMGAQMPGGVAGAFGRLSSFLGVDRIFNLINFMANLHNAFMLSNSLKVTLLEMLSSVGNATGLLQSSEGENVDLNEVYNQGVRALINSVLGDEQAARLEIQFRRANRIYQATTNSLNAVSGMMCSLGNVIEVSAEYGGKIGNALKAAGAIHEKAYQWMAEKFDAKVSPFMKYSQTVNGVSTTLETINEIAESVVEGQQAATEFQKANTEFIKAVADVQKSPGIENKAVALQVAKQKENATKDPTGEDETGLLSFLTDL